MRRARHVLIALLLAGGGVLAWWLYAELQVRPYRQFFERARWIGFRLNMASLVADDQRSLLSFDTIVPKYRGDFANPFGSGKMHGLPLGAPPESGNFVYLPVAWHVTPHYDPQHLGSEYDDASASWRDVRGQWWYDVEKIEWVTTGKLPQAQPGQYVEIATSALVFYGPRPPMEMRAELDVAVNFGDYMNIDNTWLRHEAARAGVNDAVLDQIDWDSVNYVWSNYISHFNDGMRTSSFIKRHPELKQNPERHHKTRPEYYYRGRP